MIRWYLILELFDLVIVLSCITSLHLVHVRHPAIIVPENIWNCQTNYKLKKNISSSLTLCAEPSHCSDFSVYSEGERHPLLEQWCRRPPGGRRWPPRSPAAWRSWWRASRNISSGRSRTWLAATQCKVRGGDWHLILSPLNISTQ